jgi:UMF1 family MFS transporter
VIGRISGIGWAAGYLGGIVALVLALGLFVLPDEPAFGISKDNHENIRATCVLVALWFGLLSIPMFLWVKEDKSAVGTGGRSVWSAGWLQLKATVKELRSYRQIVRFLLARVFYNDGLVTIFAFGGIYFNATFPSQDANDAMTRLIAFGILLNVTAGIGAFAFGFIDDKIGSKPTILITIVCLALASATALWTRNEAVFWVAGAFLGIFVGPNQAASRTLMGRFVPPDKENEFFGFFAFSGKATAFMGPFFFSLLVASLAEPFGAQNARSTAMSVTIVFFLIGGLLLLTVNEKEGIEAAHRTD